ASTRRRRSRGRSDFGVTATGTSGYNPGISTAGVSVMPSPFPGMDPFLENPELWPDVHHGLVSELQAQLNRVVMPRYVARVELRVYLITEDDPASNLIRVPDVRIESQSAQSLKKMPTRRGTAVAEPIEMIT